MNNQTLREKIIEMFNRGAAHLYLYSEYESLRMNPDVHGFIIDSVIIKATGKTNPTNRSKYGNVRKRCMQLFRMIRDRKLTGYYFTPRTLLDYWEHLAYPKSQISTAEFMKQPWAVKALEERQRQEHEDRNRARELARCLRRFHEVVV